MVTLIPGAIEYLYVVLQCYCALDVYLGTFIDSGPLGEYFKKEKPKERHVTNTKYFDVVQTEDTKLKAPE